MARLLLVALAVLSVIAFTDAQLRPMSLSQLVRGASPMQMRPGMQRQQSGLTRQQPGTQQQRPGMQQQRPGMPQQRPGMQQQGMGTMQGRPGMEETGGPRMWENMEKDKNDKEKWNKENDKGKENDKEKWEKKKDEEKEKWLKDSKDGSERERSGEGEGRNGGESRPALPAEIIQRLREFYELVSVGCKNQATGTWADVCSYLSDDAVAEVVEVIWNAVRDAGSDEGDSAGVSDKSTADSESSESNEDSESSESTGDSESDESTEDSESDESTGDSESDESTQDSESDAAGVLNNARNALNNLFG